jgi:hypothetical protein
MNDELNTDPLATPTTYTDDELNTVELSPASQQLRIQQARRHECLAWFLVCVLIATLVLGTLALVYVLRLP